MCGIHYNNKNKRKREEEWWLYKCWQRGRKLVYYFGSSLNEEYVIILIINGCKLYLISYQSEQFKYLVRIKVAKVDISSSVSRFQYFGKQKVLSRIHKTLSSAKYRKVALQVYFFIRVTVLWSVVLYLVCRYLLGHRGRRSFYLLQVDTIMFLRKILFTVGWLLFLFPVA